jgi:LytS/YehU family sensor histidine kinase
VARTQRIQSINEKLATSQLTALRSQMNPHFMFNILNAVQGLIYSNQKRKANSFIGTFSTLMRKTLDVSGKREITIKEELETIELYISLEKARFEDGEFCYEIVLPREELSQYTLPSLIVQPFVENAIKHGLMHKRGLKKLILQLEKYDEKYWKLSIEDNGIGRKKSMQINQKIEGKPKPFAMNAFYERIELINKLSQRPIKIEVLDLVSDSQESAGTRVTLFIPINHENTNS